MDVKIKEEHIEGLKREAEQVVSYAYDKGYKDGSKERDYEDDYWRSQWLIDQYARENGLKRWKLDADLLSASFCPWSFDIKTSSDCRDFETCEECWEKALEHATVYAVKDTCKTKNSPSDESKDEECITYQTENKIAEIDRFTDEQKRTMYRAIAVFGDEHQIDLAIEEMSELTKALLKRRRAIEKTIDSGAYFNEQAHSAAIATELADVMITCYQIAAICGIYKETKREIDYKLNRLKERLQND